MTKPVPAGFHTLTPHIVRVLELSEPDLRPFRIGRDTGGVFQELPVGLGGVRPVADPCILQGLPRMAPGEFPLTALQQFGHVRPMAALVPSGHDRHPCAWGSRTARIA